MRLFVALELPAPDELWRSVDPLREAFPRIRWVPPENLHLTLRFLGEVGEDDVSALESLLSEVVAGGLAAPTVRFDGIGGFPSGRRATTLWVGFADPGDLLPAAATEVRDALEPRFGSEERVFRPHVTVARSTRPVRLLDAMAPVALPPEEAVLRELSLIRSFLGPDGPRYERLATWELPAGIA